MNKNGIGINAGIVWRLLDNNRRLEYREIKRLSGLSDRELNMAVGWLAREDRIQIDSYIEKGKNIIILNSTCILDRTVVIHSA